MVNDKLNRKRDFTGTKSTNMHTIPAKSNHNTDKNQIQRRIKPETTKTTEGRANIGYTERGLMKITVAKPAKTY
ncbi:hypothetical protein B7L70_04995 [Vulcanisaeta sp. EB80]|nr:hypothetical protein B7L70_04995 [Vulcanisaeta sp. EB80]